MACKYKWNGKWYTKDELQELQRSNTPEFEDLYELENTISPKYESYIKYKENLVSRLQDRLNKIKKEKKDNSTNLEYTKRLSVLEEEIKTRINGSDELVIKGLLDEIGELKSEPPISKLDFYVEKDFERLAYLSESNNEEDLQEAKSMVRFYKALGKFNVNEDHPLLENQQIYDSKGNFILPQDIKNKLDSYSLKAEEFDNIIKKKEGDTLVNNINSNTKVGKVVGSNLTYNELFFKEDGLKDISWVDMFVMDTTNGIFSTNGIVPQVGMNILQNAFQEKLVYAKSVENRINNLQKNVEKELSSIEGGKYKLEKLGILGTKGVSYELFRSKNNNGQFRDNITQRFSPEFFEKKTEMLKKLDENLKKAREEEDNSIKSALFNQAYQERTNWYKKNTIVITPGLIPEIISNNNFSEFNTHFNSEKAENYKRYLISILGETGYQEEVNKQIKLLKDYQVALEVFTDNILSDYEAGVTNDLPIEAKNRVEAWVKRNNPFIFSEYYNDNLPIKKGKLVLNPTMAYNYSIPRKNKVNINITKEGQKTDILDEETGYYDSRFSTIENNPVLKDFHNLLLEVTQSMYDIMPNEVREKFSPTSIPALKQSIAEILFDNNIPLLEKLGKVFKELYDKIRGLFGINVQESMSHARIDPINGKPEYKVNDQFFKTNKDEINNRYQIELLRFKSSMDLPLSSSISASDVYNIDTMTKEAIQILEENSNMPISKIREIYGKFIKPAKILKDGITDQVVKSNSFDLPKILKLYSYLTQEYAARQEVLPILKMMKTHYEDIKKPAITNTGKTIKNVSYDDEGGRIESTRLDGERTNAIKQFNSWFERSVLGNYGSKNEFGDDTIKRISKLGLTGNDKIDLLTSKIQTTVTGKILNTNEKIAKRKIESLLEELEKEGIDDSNIDLYKKLQLSKNKLGKDFSVTAAFDALFNFIRFKGLGYNVSSSITNFAEGQIANFTVAATGDYFTPENIYRANDIVKGSFLKNISFGKLATPGASKAAALMSRYRVLQDASNELQKASNKTTFSIFKKLAPYELTQRTEYLNQTPLMISMLLDQKVTSKLGVVSNVWDAMDSEGNLLEDFQTEENIEAWEKANSAAYNDFSSKLTKTIVNAHGDYDQLRGNMASEYVTGKALLMFKRWMSRQFYQRFGAEQIDLEAEIGNAKGRYKSHTQVSGAIHGGLIGFAGLSLLGSGPLGLLIGSSVGLLGANFYGANSDLGFIKELSVVTRELLMNLIRIPTNTITGKATIREIKLNELSEAGLSSRDVKNLQANLIDMSLTLAWVALLLFSKAMFWDDDDEQSSIRRKAHNILANRFMQLAGQSSQYVNPVDSYKNTIGDMAILRFLTDVSKVAVEAQDYLEGKDILQSGPNAGESALYNQFSKTFLPSIIKDQSLGFEGQMEKQFKKSPFDTWFQGKEKEAQIQVKRIRAEYRKELRDSGLDDKEVEKKVNKRFPRKRKGEKNSELLKIYEKG